MNKVVEGQWIDLSVPGVFVTRFYYRKANGDRTNASEHFVNLILPGLKRSRSSDTDTIRKCAALLRLFIQEMIKVDSDVEGENRNQNETSWDTALTRTHGYYRAGELVHARRSPVLAEVPTQYRNISIKPVLYAQFIEKKQHIWTREIDALVHASVRGALSRISRAQEQQHLVADNWLRISGI